MNAPSNDSPSSKPVARSDGSRAIVLGVVVAVAILWAVLVPGFIAHDLPRGEEVCESKKSTPPEHIEDAEKSCHAYFTALRRCRIEQSRIQQEISNLLPEADASAAFKDKSNVAVLKEKTETLEAINRACDGVRKAAPPLELVGLANSTSLPLYLMFYVFIGALIEKKWFSARERPQIGILIPPFVAVVCFCAVVRQWGQAGTSTAYVYLVLVSAACLWGCTLSLQRGWLRDGLIVVVVGAVYALFVDGPMEWFYSVVVNQEKHGWGYFSFKNFFVEPTSWMLESGRSLTMAMLIALLWISLLKPSKSEPEQGTLDGSAQASLRAMEHAAQEFERWQLESVILAAAFLPWSYYDWLMLSDNTSRAADYSALDLYQAVVDHLTWIATWALLSGGVVRSLQNWRESKQKFIAARPVHSVPPDITKLVLEGRPVSNLQLLLVSVAGVITLLLPILRIK